MLSYDIDSWVMISKSIIHTQQELDYVLFIKGWVMNQLWTTRTTDEGLKGFGFFQDCWQLVQPRDPAPLPFMTQMTLTPAPGPPGLALACHQQTGLRYSSFGILWLCSLIHIFDIYYEYHLAYCCILSHKQWRKKEKLESLSKGRVFQTPTLPPLSAG